MTRRTMAPAARDPEGENPQPANADDGVTGELEEMADDRFDELEQQVREERRRRGRPAPKDPSFGLSEGERDELERTGTTVSPHTGQVRHDDDHACSKGTEHEPPCKK